MYRDKIRKTIIRERVLHAVTLELTYRCNLDCFFCYNDRNFQGEPLSFDQYQTLFEDLASMQTLSLMFTGGEPMVHPRFFDLGVLAREMGFLVRVRTNGHTLTPKLARRLHDEVDPHVVEMSLHGATAQTHDRQTRVPGSFKQLIANIKGMKELSLRQRLVCTPTSWNEHEIDEMVALTRSLDVSFGWQGPVAPRDDGDTTPLSIQPSQSAWDRIKAIGTANASEDHTPNCDSPSSKEIDRVCGVGTMGVDVDPYGNVYPCMHLKRAVGNLHEQGMKEIWYGQKGASTLAQAEQLSRDAAKNFKDKPVSQYGAPLFCPAVAINAKKGVSNQSSNLKIPIVEIY